MCVTRIFECEPTDNRKTSKYENRTQESLLVSHKLEVGHGSLPSPCNTTQNMGGFQHVLLKAPLSRGCYYTKLQETHFSGEPGMSLRAIRETGPVIPITWRARPQV